MAWARQEVDTKVRRVRALMEKENIPYLLVTNQTNFYWLTGGRPYINPAVEKACADLLITPDQLYLVSNNIEADRLLCEELAGIGAEKLAYNWWESSGLRNALQQVSQDANIITDTELGPKFTRLRWELLPQEQDRFAAAGRSVVAVLEEVAFSIRPGLSELDIATLQRAAAISVGVNPLVNLVAVDDRAYQYRHPLPTEKKMERYCMLVLSGQKHGLYASATRLVHFGPVPAELKRRHEAVTKVDAAFIAATRPGVKVADVFAAGRAAYRELGFADEWRYHHQGGLTGYSSREYRGTPDNPETVAANQAFAWNPTIAGVKSEDTILVTKDETVTLSLGNRFPKIEVEYNGIRLTRPGILER